MLYLLLAILSSAMVSIVMRLSSDRISGNLSMLSMNYLMCMVVAAFYTGFDSLLPDSPHLPQTLGMGAIHGLLYLSSFVLLQLNVKKNGVVMSSTFMKLGLLVPMIVSICFFGEVPNWMQIIGFLFAITAILLINLQKDESALSFKAGLILHRVGTHKKVFVNSQLLEDASSLGHLSHTEMNDFMAGGLCNIVTVKNHTAAT